jgi:hypothetical protein
MVANGRTRPLSRCLKAQFIARPSTSARPNVASGSKWPSRRFHGKIVLRRRARWKWRRKPLNRLFSAIEMAVSAVGGRRLKGLRDRSEEGTGFGAQHAEESGSRKGLRGSDAKRR